MRSDEAGSCPAGWCQWRTRPGRWRPVTSNGWWSTPRSSRRRSRIRPMRGCATAPLEKLVDLAQHNDVKLRQSYRRARSSASAKASPSPLRVRLQGVGRDAGNQAQGRPVRAPRQGVVRQSVRWPHLGAGHRRPRETDRIETRRIHVDKGYRGHNHKEKFRVWITGQVRRVTRPIRREMKRRAAVEPVIGHVKAEHRMGRNYLKGRDGDRINAVLAAAGYNFSLLLRWLARLLCAFIRALFPAPLAYQIG